MANNKFCIECRFELPITAKFCERCGFAFVLNQSTSESEPEIKQDKQPVTESLKSKVKEITSGFLGLIIIFVSAFIGGAIGGLILGPIGGIVGGIGCLLLGRLIAKSIIDFKMDERSGNDDLEVEAKVKAKAEENDHKTIEEKKFDQNDSKADLECMRQRDSGYFKWIMWIILVIFSSPFIFLALVYLNE